ncbi:V-type ATP synthase subunit I [Candidatus Arthromitus sp. SFB-mouse-Japan]|uniref:V-type ATP synthase subunit I n=1 Tax=unclassified Candidatus Neoarthromitus TaxID=2638829 RepID=UPI00021B7DAD|nr:MULTISPECIES: V-type ATP synthase subunit I [unclassified Candidatus Arthromitus]EIA24686.1 V-type ATPase [Candidatus Arthromitus sp. SFB-2]EIA28688.1 V-type ATPase [Candidatus Arthromitus sp. SFB-co]EIA30363.1 V-type ATPase [Candidatus Arthromitus sp. SFB-mouse-SU]AID44258.1 V-type ATP synthase subunit I [Candidatus Arthromitus sp. SFB-mouse-NL]EGX29234.1 V-type ATP synthase, subunit I [Candidatus Arthromitus sp. SFB-mouse-NYU]
MAIVKMKKFSLYFLESDKERILNELQAFGGLEFNNFDKCIDGKEDKKLSDILGKLRHLELDNQNIAFEQNLNKLKYCLDVLKPYANKKSMLKVLTDDKLEIEYPKLVEHMENNNWERVYNNLQEINSRIVELDSEYLKCMSEIDTIKYWRNIRGNIKDYNNLKYSTCFLGNISKQFENEIINKFEQDFKYSFIDLVHSTQKDSYFLIVIHNDFKDEVLEFLKNRGFNFQTFHYNTSINECLRNLEESKKNISIEKDRLKKSIEKYSSNYLDLQYAYEYFNSNKEKAHLLQKFVRSDSVIISQGYVESDNVVNLEKCLLDIKELDFYLHIEDINDEDILDVPVKLSNGYVAAPFEGVVEMYSYPIYSEIDPSPVISVFFIVFFGMMLADAGYGILMVLISIFLYIKSKTREKKNSYRLFIFSGISTTIWGVLYGAYFGDLLERYFGINVPVVLDVNNDIMTIFLIAIAFGFVHLVLGLIMKAIVYFKNGKIIDILYDVLPWLMILVGVLIIALQNVITFIAPQIPGIIIGLGILILLFTQGRDAESLVGKIGGGVYGVYGISSYLGDIISYSRLLALGLASGFIANAFNIMGGLIPFPFNIIITPLMLIPLHLFNLGINALGTYVHSSRLQYLEFFGKFYSGGGRKFMPFKYTDEYIRIKK